VARAELVRNWLWLFVKELAGESEDETSDSYEGSQEAPSRCPDYLGFCGPIEERLERELRKLIAAAKELARASFLLTAGKLVSQPDLIPATLSLSRSTVQLSRHADILLQPVSGKVA